MMRTQKLLKTLLSVVGVVGLAGCPLTAANPFGSPCTVDDDCGDTLVCGAAGQCVPGASIALRLGQRAPEGDPTPNHNLRLLNSSLEANVQTGFASGIDIIAEGGGTVRIMGTDIRGSASDASETRGITSIGSNVRANSTLFFAAHPFFVENGELRCAHCGIESFTNEVVDPTGAGSVLCLNSYDEASFDPLDTLCAQL